VITRFRRPSGREGVLMFALRVRPFPNGAFWPEMFDVVLYSALFVAPHLALAIGALPALKVNIDLLNLTPGARRLLILARFAKRCSREPFRSGTSSHD
jgi:hypothetical protein